MILRYEFFRIEQQHLHLPTFSPHHVHRPLWLHFTIGGGSWLLFQQVQLLTGPMDAGHTLSQLSYMLLYYKGEIIL